VAVSVGWMMALVTLFWHDLMMIVAWCCIIAAGLVLWVESRTRSRYASSQRRLSYGTSWRLITAKYPGRCVQCSGAIAPGERIRWRKGIGVAHDKCH
jgi:hypothetical protein